MKILITFSFLFFIFASQAQNWEVIWEDNFEGSELDETNWSHDLGTGSAQGLYGWGNSELQYYQPENATVNNGILTIQVQEEPQGISDYYSGYEPYYYSSSKIVTRDKFEFTFGKVEARIKTIDGQGYWPAFWMLAGGCWPETGEIDIMEQWGNDGPTNQTTGAAHMGNCGESSTYVYWNENISSGSFADDYHVYSIIWYEDYIGWYLDDVLVNSVTPDDYSSDLNWPFNSNDWYLILNLAITNSGPNGNTVIPGQIQVDYVRVSQTSDVIGCLNSQAVNYNPEAIISNDSCLFEVNFSVDMNCSAEPYSTVYVTGPFSGWCGNCNPLEDPDQDNIWTGTYEFPEENLEYKYLVDNWSGQENLIDDMVNGASCAPITDYSTYANRLIAIPEITNTADSYGLCSNCNLVTEGCTHPDAVNYNPNAITDDGSCIIYGCLNEAAANYNPEANVQLVPCLFLVNFSLDMNEVSFDFTTPEVNGTWNDWCGGCISMTDDNLDNIWIASALLQEGIYEFKYATDVWTQSESFTSDQECTLTTGIYINRIFTVDGPVDYPLTCWGSCEACTLSGCTDPSYIEYDPFALIDDSSCSTLKVLGCIYQDATNYDSSANSDNLSCIFNLSSCSGDYNQDGAVTISDLSGFLASFGTLCE